MGRVEKFSLLGSLLLAAVAGCVTEFADPNASVLYSDASVLLADARRGFDATAASNDRAAAPADARTVANDAGAAPTCDQDGNCPAGAVCCPAPLPCALQCVPDCRVSTNSCPTFAPACDQATGLCARADDGGLPPPPDGGMMPPRDGGQPPPPDGGLQPEACADDGTCGPGAVCCPESLPCAGQCVPDCRVSTEACPEQAPVCDRTSGLCAPDSVPVPDAAVPVPDAAPPACTTDCPPPPCGNTGSPCPPGAVCCPPGAPCAGTCVPDCRVNGLCPPQGPICDYNTGFCHP